MSLKAQVFTGITPEIFTKIVALVQQKLGVTLAGDGGAASSKDMAWLVQWEHDTVARTLKVQVIKKPFLEPASLILHELAQQIEALGGFLEE